MDVAQREHELAEELERLARRHRLPAEALGEVAALEELHHQVHVVLGAAVAEDARHVAALDALDHGVLLHEALERLLVEHDLLAQDLHHQRLVVVLARGEVHARRAALADQVQHLDARDADLGAEVVAFQARGEVRRHGALDLGRGELADRRDQLFARELLLALVVVGAGLHRAHGDDLVAGTGEEEDLRTVLALLEDLQPLQAVAAPEHVVEHHDVVVPQRERRVGDVALQRIVGFDLGIGPLAADVARQQVAQVLIVVDEQDAHRPTYS